MILYIFFLSNPFHPYCPDIEGVSSMKFLFCWPLRHISYFLVVFCGWKSNHMMTKTQFWMMSSGCGCSETHQISRPMGIIHAKFLLGMIFWKLAKTSSIQFSIPLCQVGFPTTQLEFQPLKWRDGWNSNHQPCISQCLVLFFILSRKKFGDLLFACN